MIYNRQAVKKMLAGRTTEFKVLENMSKEIYSKIPGGTPDYSAADEEFAKLKQEWAEVHLNIQKLVETMRKTPTDATDPVKTSEATSAVQIGKLLIADELQSFHREVETIQTVLKSTETDISSAPELCGGDYSNFSQQEDALKVIKQNLETVDNSIEQAQQHKNLLSQHLPEDSDRSQLDLLMNSLRIYSKSIKDAYKNKYKYQIHYFPND